MYRISERFDVIFIFVPISGFIGIDVSFSHFIVFLLEYEFYELKRRLSLEVD